jgi:hypothetical protein
MADAESDDRRVHRVRQSFRDVLREASVSGLAAVTSGVAVADLGSNGQSLSADDLRDLATVERDEPERASPDVRRDDSPVDRGGRYGGHVSPNHADTPRDIARRERSDDGAKTPDGRPARRADRDVDDRGPTEERRPDERAGRAGDEES